MLFAVGTDGRLNCGASPAAAAALLGSMGARAVGFSSPDPELLEEALEAAFEASPLPLWAELTAPGVGEREVLRLCRASTLLVPNEAERARIAPLAAQMTRPSREEEDKYVAAVTAGEIYWIDSAIDLSEEISPGPDFPKQILRAEDETFCALSLVIDTEEELSLFTEYQYMFKAPVCLSSSDQGMMIRAVHNFCGRALYDGNQGLDVAFIDRLVRRYGLIRL